MTRGALLALLLLAVAPARADMPSPAYRGTLTLATPDGGTRDVTGLPRFSDYKAEAPLRQRAALVDWSSNPQARQYRTRLSEGLSQSPDFNGHYKVVSYGCGTGCQGNWVLDLETGRIAGRFDTAMGASYRRDSSLIVANLPQATDISAAMRGGDPSYEHITFYQVKNGSLRLVQDLATAPAAASGQ